MDYDNEVQYWLNEIDDAKKREKDWRENAELLKKLYDGHKPDENPFNILYSNTNTLLPALYSNLPRPAVKERFAQKDNQGFTKVNPLHRAIREASNNMLSYLLDTNVEGYEKFHDSIKADVLDAAVTGRGVPSVEFDAKIEDKIEWASIVVNTKKYNRFFHGFATKWENVPWICYEEFIDEKEAKEKFGDLANELSYTISDEDDKKVETENKRKTAQIYQIWCKDSKTIKWISPGYDKKLREDEDPLGITGFFNCPKPLMLHRKSNDLLPTPLYQLYENQAKELDRLTRSINKVAAAIKVRGGYDGTLGEIFERILDEEDNVLVPVENVTALMDGGFDKHIWLLPLGELVGVLNQLYVAREQCKQVIYEITGISDILRGQTKASETLGAQAKKEAWGTLRMKNMQEDVQDHIKSILRIMLDIAVKNVPQNIWIEVTGLPYPTREKKKRAVKLINKVKEQIAQLNPNERERGEQLAQRAAEITNLLAMPSWEDILSTLKDDYIRSFKVDIETNSTLDIEATEDKKEIAEGMNAMAQFMNGLMPMVANRILPFRAAQSMLLDIAKRFRFGQEVEEEIQAMEAPQGPNTEQVQEQQKQLMEQGKKLAQERQKFQEEQQRIGQEFDKQANALQMEKMQLEFEKKLFQERQKLIAMETKMQDQLSEEKRQLKSAVDSARNEVTQTKAETKLQGMIDKHAKNVQSLVDKQVSNFQKISESYEAPKTKKKVAKLIYEDGRPIGAEIEELDEEANGDVTITYNDEGRPDGAVVN